MLAQKFGVRDPRDRRHVRRRAARLGAAGGAAEGARGRGAVLPRAARGAGRRAGARSSSPSAASTPQTIEQLGLGFAPSARDGLKARLLAQGFAQGLLLQSGLVVQRESGEVVDRFRNRLMVPICRDTGSVIAFGGRADGPRSGRPKYLNSPETPIYSKGRTLYGLNLTKAADPEGRLRGAGRRLFRLRAGVSVPGGAGGRLVRHRADAAAGAAAAAIHVEGRPELRSRRGRARGGGAIVRAARRRRVRRQRRGAGQGRRSRYVHPEERRRRVPGQAAHVAAVSRVPARSGRRRARFRARRQPPAVSGKMLAVAARIPDAAARDQFADRIAHKARITEEVVRAEIRKAAGQQADRRDRPRDAVLRAAETRGKGPDLGFDPQYQARRSRRCPSSTTRIWRSWRGGRSSRWRGACTRSRLDLLPSALVAASKYQ